MPQSGWTHPGSPCDSSGAQVSRDAWRRPVLKPHPSTQVLDGSTEPAAPVPVSCRRVRASLATEFDDASGTTRPQGRHDPDLPGKRHRVSRSPSWNAAHAPCSRSGPRIATATMPGNSVSTTRNGRTPRRPSAAMPRRSTPSPSASSARSARTAPTEVAEGQTLTVELFKAIDAGRRHRHQQGRGFAGVIKRHGFHGLRATHGVKRMHRHPGSSGPAPTRPAPRRASASRASTATPGSRSGTSRSSGSIRPTTCS